MKKKNMIPALIYFGLIAVIFQSCAPNTAKNEAKDQDTTIQKSNSENVAAVVKPEFGSFTDVRDGKVYKTVKIGNQIWMAENLSFLTNGIWTFQYDDNNVSKYGYLYDWETAKTVCPAGWHLPSDTEWTTLSNYLGGDNVAGGKLRATTDWQQDVNGNATNESGFSALPSGTYCKCEGDEFTSPGMIAKYWTASSADGNAWTRTLDFNNAILGRSSEGIYSYGYSVRCVKD